MIHRIFFTVFISLMVSLAGTHMIAGKGGNTMAMSRPLEAYNKDIPKIDMNPPAVTETATFALG